MTDAERANMIGRRIAVARAQLVAAEREADEIGVGANRVLNELDGAGMRLLDARDAAEELERGLRLTS